MVFYERSIPVLQGLLTPPKKRRFIRSEVPLQALYSWGIHGGFLDINTCRGLSALGKHAMKLHPQERNRVFL